MTKQSLNANQIGTSLEQAGCEIVSQDVRSQSSSRHSCFICQLIHQALNASRLQSITFLGYKQMVSFWIS